MRVGDTVKLTNDGLDYLNSFLSGAREAIGRLFVACRYVRIESIDSAGLHTLTVTMLDTNGRELSMYIGSSHYDTIGQLGINNE